MSHFPKAYEYTLKNEGGWSNHPADRGGATMMGVTLATFSRWLGRQATEAELKAIAPETVKAIYKEWYFDVNRLDEVKSFAIACAIYDIGVVCGVRTAARLAQRALRDLGDNLIVVDGIIGRATLRSLNQVDPKKFVHTFKARVDAHFQGIVDRNQSQKVFLRGWLNRSRRLLTLV
jgi:lysozyme family protein